MKIFKFGGASLQNASYIKNVANIIQEHSHEHLIVVVSAMAKTTNELEKVHRSYMMQSNETNYILENIISFHYSILQDLFKPADEVYNSINKCFHVLKKKLKQAPTDDYDYEYDQIVIYGELVSSIVIFHYLRSVGIDVKWIDIRKMLKTNSNYRDANILFDNSIEKVRKVFFKKGIYICQGFIGSDENGNSTTLGREGSDYTAAALAYMLDAQNVTIWKDVPGVLNADPRIISNVKKLERITYKEAIELAYYGAQVIHPKTIKPLQNKNIPLFVKPFFNPNEKGTIVQDTNEKIELPPIYIHKFNQALISIMPKDFSFIAEDNLSIIFKNLSEAKIKVNMMQQSAISFSVCVDYEERRLKKFLSSMQNDFDVLYNTDLTLITIRHYTDEAIKSLLKNNKILLKEISRKTARIVIQSDNSFQHA